MGKHIFLLLWWVKVLLLLFIWSRFEVEKWTNEWMLDYVFYWGKLTIFFDFDITSVRTETTIQVFFLIQGRFPVVTFTSMCSDAIASWSNPWRWQKETSNQKKVDEKREEWLGLIDREGEVSPRKYGIGMKERKSRLIRFCHCSCEGIGFNITNIMCHCWDKAAEQRVVTNVYKFL